ncbi:hypothetical protein [Sanguibacter sp. 25GB23B1]|uniref:hypothetical protein n=1 Tax=unclassified Sanguibacter TaxID=2645534 RepID=UPI0032AF9192
MSGAAPDRHGPSVYELRVLGLIPGDVLEALGEVAIESASVSTVLSRAFTDQAQLLGFVTRLRTLGLEVVEVQRLQADTLPAERPPAGHPQAEIGPDQPPG